ncbi:C-C chemokine receptor type 7-like [Scyliorhinus canicula]|uniref:C-C chemokine receptor type 7-like n=1 Tax=Scyliorhinus canicula TaxID=7830 RepID=UPI0018F69400|nr:C-C chemokine receptor type 7-like [Scyliorhinus canicula]XP_038635525.1 C-C chemokine receptor type 7-like [Scyliorhinus canicula]
MSGTTADSATTICPDGCTSTDSDGYDYSGYPEPCNKNEVQKFNRILQPCIYSLLFILGLVGNGLVLGTYIHHKRWKAMTDMYLLNLAIADILFLITLPFLAASSQSGWGFGKPMCVIMQILYKMNVYSSFLFLMCVSVDRYFVIVRATVAHRLRSKRVRYSRFVSLIVWIVSLFLSLQQLIYAQVEIHHGTICSVSYQDSINIWIKVVTPILQMVLGFFLPLFVMIFCYSVIVKTLLEARNFEKHKAIKVILAVVLIFIIFQAPYNILNIINIMDTMRGSGLHCSDSKVRDIALQVTSCLAYTRCCLNPILYVFVGVKFRNNLLKLLSHLGFIKKKQRTASTTRPMSVLNTDTSSTLAL